MAPVAHEFLTILALAGRVCVGLIFTMAAAQKIGHLLGAFFALQRAHRENKRAAIRHHACGGIKQFA